MQQILSHRTCAEQRPQRRELQIARKSELLTPERIQHIVCVLQHYSVERRGRVVVQKRCRNDAGEAAQAAGARQLPIALVDRSGCGHYFQEMSLTPAAGGHGHAWESHSGKPAGVGTAIPRLLGTFSYRIFARGSHPEEAVVLRWCPRKPCRAEMSAKPPEAPLKGSFGFV